MMLEAVGQVNAEASATSVAVAVGAAGGAGAVIPGPEPDNGVYIPIIFTVRTTTPNESVIIPLEGSGLYNGVIEWGDGATASNAFDNRTHTYATAGDKRVKITGRTIGFSFEPANGATNDKFISFQQWGTVRFYFPGGWDSFFQDTPNLDLTTVTDVPTMIGVTTFSEAFAGAIYPIYRTSVNRLNEWDMSKSMYFSNCFRRNFSFNMNLGSWDMSSALYLNSMFYRANQFNNGGSPTINNWNTSKVVNMSAMFYQTAFNQPIGSWNVSKVEDMGQMLQQTPFNQDISSWNVGRVKSMGAMFYYNTAFNQNIGNWNVSSVTNMSYMFEGATAFDQNIGNWSIGTVSNFTNFMSTKTNLTFSSANLDAIYNGWSGQNVQPNITISFGTAQYTAAGAAGRALLVSKGWTIIDGGQTP
jgi:surface protein